MAITYSRAGGTATVTVTVDVNDLIPAAVITQPVKVGIAFDRAIAQLQAASTSQQGAPQLANQIAALQAAQAALPAAIPNF